MKDIELHNGDCFEVMDRIPEGTIDFILSDPPYELTQSQGGGLMGKDQGRVFMEQIHDANISQGFEVNKFLNSCYHLFPTAEKFNAVFFMSMKQLSKYIKWAELNELQHSVGVWHKTNPAPLCNNKYLGDIEYWMYIKGKKAPILGSYATKGMVYTSAVNQKDKKLFGHPTIKPVPLMDKFILNHTEEGQTILDPFMGSGTTGVACKKRKRNFIGIELEEKYFKTSQERINNTKMRNSHLMKKKI